MTEDGELTADQAECMLDNLDFVALAGISSGDEPDPEISSALFNVAVTCDQSTRLSLERSAPMQFRSTTLEPPSWIKRSDSALVPRTGFEPVLPP